MTYALRCGHNKSTIPRLASKRSRGTIRIGDRHAEDVTAAICGAALAKHSPRRVTVTRDAQRVRQALIAASRQAGNATVEFQVQQHHGKCVGRQAAACGEFVEPAGIEAHQRRATHRRGRAACSRDIRFDAVALAGRQQRSSSSTSCAVSTSLAPCLISLWQPRDCGEWIEPGMAKTSRPCSPASRAVISEPLSMAASTTRTPRAIPEIRRLRRGKLAAQ